MLVKSSEPSEGRKPAPTLGLGVRRVSLGFKVQGLGFAV